MRTYPFPGNDHAFLHNAGSGTLAKEEQSVVYVLTDTVNDVIQSIRQDKNFQDQLEPVA